MQARQDHDPIGVAKPFQLPEPTHVPHIRFCTVATSVQRSSEPGSPASCTAGDAPVPHALSTSAPTIHQQSPRLQDAQARLVADMTIATANCPQKVSSSTHVPTTAGHPITIRTDMKMEMQELHLLPHAAPSLAVAIATPPTQTQSPSAPPSTTSAYPGAPAGAMATRAEVGGTRRIAAATRRSRGGARRRRGRGRSSIW